MISRGSVSLFCLYVSVGVAVSSALLMTSLIQMDSESICCLVVSVSGVLLACCMSFVSVVWNLFQSVLL